MSSFLELKNGIYNPALRFAFTNITEEDFVSAWDASPITVGAGQTVELPHHLAVKLTGELVDKIMIGEAKLDEVTKNKEGYRSPKGMSLGVPAARKIWEDQVLKPLELDEESPQVQVLRAQIKEELLKDLSKETAQGQVELPSSLGEFSELKKSGETEKPSPKKPIKLKKI